MINIKKGITHKPATCEKLIKFFRAHQEFEGSCYIGYPILFAGGESISIDSLWISKKYGIIVFDMVEDSTDIMDRSELQDRLYNLIDSQLRLYPELKKNRKELAVNIEVLTFAPNAYSEDPFTFKNEEELETKLNEFNIWKSPELFDKVISVLQSVIHLREKQKREIKNEGSRGGKLSGLENTLATLDGEQESAVIEYFEGIQRIRGLAGSGKTIVLALKAAYLHTQNPDWLIAVTFNTRALKQQFKNLIAKFCIEKKRELPDWTKIKVINAWGRSSDGENEKGLYYEFCIDHGIEYYDYKRAQSYAFSKGIKVDQPFELVCQKAIGEVKSSIEKYDAILVDEAQDLSEAFLNLCYRFLTKKKRLIYAYDELQKLNEGSSLRNPKDLLNNKLYYDKLTKGIK